MKFPIVVKLPILSWKHISIFVGLYTVLGCVIWLIKILSNSAHWCGVPVGAAKATGARLPISDCTSILLELIDKLGSLALVLVGCFAIGLLTWVVIALGANLSFRGPAGIGGDVHGERGGDQSETKGN